MNTRLTTTAAPRRGNVLIFALAILAVLALLGATYVTRANLDRVASTAAVQRSALDREPEKVISHIRALLTADLFGNKIVTDATPRFLSQDELEAASANLTGSGGTASGTERVSVWPAMFEDGENRDYPAVDEIDYTSQTYTFGRTENPGDDPEINPARPAARLRYNQSLERMEVARPDDAWLAASEPVDSTGTEALGSYNGGWNTWPQISNIRSAYRWDPDADGQGNGAWVRDDGRYADLAMFFLSPEASTNGRGDPGADLLDRTDSRRPFYDPDDASSVLGLSPDFNSALLGVEQRGVYGYQMNQLAEWYENSSTNPDAVSPAPFEPVDERFWADTDGDGRPDARWTQIDELNGAQGLIWVAAVRIEDSSDAVNVNTSLGSLPSVASASASDVYGDGTTPMDTDFERLLDEGTIANIASSAGPGFSLSHPDIVGLGIPEITGGMTGHMISGLGFESFVDTAATTYFNGTDNAVLKEQIGWDAEDNSFQPSLMTPTQRRPTSRAQREAYWRLYAANPLSPEIPARSYALGQEVDLRAAVGSTSPGVVSELESRFDGADAVQRLPGQTGQPYPTGNNTLGPLRAQEFADAVSTADVSGVTRPGLSGQYRQQEKIERIEKDVRRSLTVASGSSARSVVPAIGHKEVPRNHLKPIVNDIPRQDRQTAVEDAYDAFVWALAPLATNVPMMRDLAGPNPARWITDYNTEYAVDPDYHYGGGTTGPARAWATEIGADPNTLGPTYALFRAASLAVNLADAVDNEGADPEPTLARLFPRPEIDTTLPPFNSGATPGPLDGVVTLTTRLTQGDIDDADPGQANGDGTTGGSPIIPTQAVRRDSWGVTFAGLDRQPFISEAFTMCLYKFETNPVSFTNPPVNPVDLSMGDIVDGRAIVAVELINPWPSPIDLVGYSVMLTDGFNSITFDLDGIAPAGERHVVYWHNLDDTSPLDDLDAEVPSSSPIPTASMDEIGDPFSGWNRTTTSVLLYRNDPAGAGTTPQILVDRLASSGTDPFPATTGDLGMPSLATALSPTTLPGESSGAYFSTASNLARSTDFPAGGGFPFTVIENKAYNEVHTVVSGDDTGSEGWHSDETNITRNHFEMMNEDAPGAWTDTFTLGDVNVNGAFPAAGVDPFQLFVPDGRLLSGAELGMLCTFAHTFNHPDAGFPVVVEADADPDSSNWTTVSEWLGKEYHLNYDASAGAAPTMTTADPNLGVLDPTRYILGTNGDIAAGDTTLGINGLPDSMTIPLAQRVFDAFEVLGENLDASEPLIPGRININTAPKRVLAALPLVLPVEYTNGGQIPGDLTSAGLDQQTAYARLNAIVQYRERLGPIWNNLDTDLGWDDWDYSTPRKLTGLTDPREGYRVAYSRSSGSTAITGPTSNQHRKGRGFASLGELAALAKWTPAVPDAPALSSIPNEQGMLELASDSTNNTLDITNLERNALDARPQRDPTGMAFAFDGVNLEPQDDPEERLGLFRAVANTASVRSDVFHAWYVVRAYSPADIEAIAVNSGDTDIEKSELLNQLTPVFERRGMVVLDRSNVSSPVDRPRVLNRVVLGRTSATN